MWISWISISLCFNFEMNGLFDLLIDVKLILLLHENKKFKLLFFLKYGILKIYSINYYY